MQRVNIKRCFKCSVRKSVNYFYAHPEMKDGYLNKCKDCSRKDISLNRGLKIEYYRKYDRDRGNRQPSWYLKSYRSKNPEKYKAHCALNNAVRDGRVKKGTCLVCKDVNVHGHHEDYTKPLDVIWLCASHHMEAHARKAS